LVCIFAQPLSAQQNASTISEAKKALESQDFETAQEMFGQLAEKENPLSQQHARLMLGKATADYRLNDLAEARKSYSKAMIAEDSRLRSAAHQGMGNTLFQLGWMELADGSTYPGEEAAKEQFDELLKARMDEWLGDSKTDAKETSAGMRKMQNIMLNWADSVRHSQSAMDLQPANLSAQQNAATARLYLEKLRQKMEQQQQEMQQQMQGQGEEQGPEPNEGEGEGDQEGEGKGQNGDPKEGSGDQNGEQNGEGKQDPNQTPKGQEPDPNNAHGKDRQPGETKEQQALRKLNENADLQRGIVAPGRHEFRRPTKDW
jgi:hypothetical protein